MFQEDEYVEMLSEIMTLNQYTISEQIAKYGSYNTTKGFVDFIMTQQTSHLAWKTLWNPFLLMTKPLSLFMTH